MILVYNYKFTVDRQNMCCCYIAGLERKGCKYYLLAFKTPTHLKSASLGTYYEPTFMTIKTCHVDQTEAQHLKRFILPEIE